VFSPEELEGIARLCVEHDLLAVTDEVYEHLVFDGVHRPLATLPGMAERTLSISSAGKTFSFTGWKVGWATGPAALVDAVRTTKQFLTFVSGGPFQHAIAVGLELDDGYFTELAAGLAAKRDLVSDGLEKAGFEVHRPERCGVVAIPSAAFYLHPDRGRHLLRFAFCKRDSVLHEAVARLGNLR
jgi:N-succinyldiaminopimelate aminotransferase